MVTRGPVDASPAMAGLGGAPSPAATTEPPRSVSGLPGSISGEATWFATGPDCLCAAAGPALRAFLGPHWRGTRVRVCAGRCITVLLNDWMKADRLIDLSDQAFRLLAKLSRGVVWVTVG